MMKRLNCLLVAAFLTSGILLLGCPEKQQPAQEGQAPDSSGEATPVAAGEIAALDWPLPWLQLPQNAQLTPLPESVSAGYENLKELSEDAAVMHVALEGGVQEYWWAAFDSDAAPAELQQHFDTVFEGQGFEADVSVNQLNMEDGARYFQALYSKPDGSWGVRIYHADYDAVFGEAGSPVIISVQRFGTGVRGDSDQASPATPG
jgi:hypothetical protein